MTVFIKDQIVQHPTCSSESTNFTPSPLPKGDIFPQVHKMQSQKEIKCFQWNTFSKIGRLREIANMRKDFLYFMWLQKMDI